MENHNCENCKYFVKYYMIFKKNRLIFANSGHCKHDKISKRKKAINKNLTCEYWEEPENEVSEEKLEKEIRKIKRRLDEMALLLKHE